jgi:hypothetical protein
VPEGEAGVDGQDHGVEGVVAGEGAGGDVVKGPVKDAPDVTEVRLEEEGPVEDAEGMAL